MKNLKFAFVLVMVLLGSGCSSIHSTHLKRAKEMCGWKTTRLNGVPITLDVPHQFKVEVIETYYEHRNTSNLLLDSANGNPITTRSVRCEVIDKKEIFTVDFVKPGAGTLETKADLDPKRQYFTQIDNKIEDTTIEAITNSISKISGALPFGRAARGYALDSSLMPHEKTLAVAVVDVSDPHAEQKIHDFLCLHLNGCNNCATPAGSYAPSSDMGHPASMNRMVVPGNQPPLQMPPRISPQARSRWSPPINPVNYASRPRKSAFGSHR